MDNYPSIPNLNELTKCSVKRCYPPRDSEILTYNSQGELSEDRLLDSTTSVEYWFEVFNETTSNDSSPMDLRILRVVNRGNSKTYQDKKKSGVEKDKNKIGSGVTSRYYIDRYNKNDYRELSEDVLLANATSVEYWFEVFNETASNDSSPMDIRSQNAGNKGSDKTFKDKMKTGVEKVKNKANEIKNKIGNGGMPGGIQYMNRHNRNDYRSRNNIGAGSGHADPRDKWVAAGISIFLAVGELSEDLPLENTTSVEFWFEVFNETASNDSSPMDLAVHRVLNRGQSKTTQAKSDPNKNQMGSGGTNRYHINRYDGGNRNYGGGSGSEGGGNTVYIVFTVYAIIGIKSRLPAVNQFTGYVIIGIKSRLPAVNQFTGYAIIGIKSLLPSVNQFTGYVIIGIKSRLPAVNQFTGCVIIGIKCHLPAANQFTGCVIIGIKSCLPAANQFTGCVIIGIKSCLPAANQFTGCVITGIKSSLPAANQFTGCVIIGIKSCLPAANQFTGYVIIGIKSRLPAANQITGYLNIRNKSCLPALNQFTGYRNQISPSFPPKNV
ncbi:unnamed protein product [Larinioides sclopetarius]|uniref:Uncharacterized protein n=1 Tax=Larinioides sclopetarius TaxID=280406 RepID=A0AAV2BWL5_9ARAC